MKLDETSFNKRFRNSPIKRAKRRGFLRNVAVALGNWANVEAIPALCSGLDDEEMLVRIHSAWALGQISDLQAKTKLENAKLNADGFGIGWYANNNFYLYKSILPIWNDSNLLPVAKNLSSNLPYISGVV